VNDIGEENAMYTKKVSEGKHSGTSGCAKSWKICRRAQAARIQTTRTHGTKLHW
jgi:hypothetical protein